MHALTFGEFSFLGVLMALDQVVGAVFKNIIRTVHAS